MWASEKKVGNSVDSRKGKESWDLGNLVNGTTEMLLEHSLEAGFEFFLGLFKVKPLGCLNGEV